MYEPSSCQLTSLIVSREPSLQKPLTLANVLKCKSSPPRAMLWWLVLAPFNSWGRGEKGEKLNICIGKSWGYWSVVKLWTLDSLTPLGGVSYHYSITVIPDPSSLSSHQTSGYQGLSMLMLLTWMTNESARKSLEMHEMINERHQSSRWCVTWRGSAGSWGRSPCMGRSTGSWRSSWTGPSHSCPPPAPVWRSDQAPPSLVIWKSYGW